jgi:D-3-phosphoglycerate dehydrogenase / 2-oxoglutarate reductase
MYKVLVSDKFAEVGLEVFRANPEIELDYKPGLTPEQLAEIIGQYHGLAIRSATKVTRDLLEKAVNLKVVGRAGTGVDNVDQKAATERGVCVMNTPGGNTVTTGEQALSMMMSLARNIPQACASLKSGKWEKSKFQGTEIFGKVLGVVGFGRIGRVVAERALGLKMRVLVYDPYVSADQALKAGVDKVELDELFARSDFITVHVPKNKETENMIRAETIAKMKKGVRIINCARGGIVNEADLHDALVSGQVAGAALDVFVAEPCTDSPLFKLDNIIVTPHLGASTTEAQENVTIAIAEQMIDYLVAGVVTNAVNVPSVSGEMLKALTPFILLGEKLGAMQAQLSREIPKEIAITFGGDLSELPNEGVGIAVLKGYYTRISDAGVNFVNARVVAERHGLNVRFVSQKHSIEYTNFLTVAVTYPGGAKRSLTGVKFADNDVRLTHYNDHTINIEPEGNMLILRNKDLPGVIGVVGTLLGEAGVNIANLRLARTKGAKEAMTIVTTDQTVPEETLNRLTASDKILSAKFVQL